MYKYIIKFTETVETVETVESIDVNQITLDGSDPHDPHTIIQQPIIKASIINTNANGFATIMSINLEYVNKLNKCKDKINQFKGNEWEELKKISNPYEHIYIFNSKNQYTGVAKLKPLSRSFFKMIEMVNEFGSYFKKKNTVKSLHLAEGPGGFIEAIRYIRGPGPLTINDQHFGITLIDKNKSVPCWNQSKQFLINNPQVKILYGADGTGNIYKCDNILHLVNSIVGECANEDTDNNKEKYCNLVTGDGGFDFSVDYNYQEQASSKLIFAQIICALKCLQISDNSIFICKIFDMSNYLTVELIYLISVHFKSVILYKPVTSRVANSEKYLVCRGFLGCNQQYWLELMSLLDYWNKIESEFDDKNKKNTINYIFESIPTEFVLMIKKINMAIIDLQIESINTTISAKKSILYSSVNNSAADANTELIEKNKKLNIENARNWCAKNGIPYN